MSEPLTFLRIIWVRAIAKRDVKNDKVGAFEIQGAANNNGYYVCPFFRKEMDKFYRYCAAQKKKLWTNSYNDKLEHIEENIHKEKYGVANYSRISTITARLDRLKKETDLTPELSKEITEREAQLAALQGRADAEKKELLIDRGKSLSEISSVLDKYENKVSVRRSRCLSSISAYWGVVQQCHKELPPFRWSMNSLGQYYNLKDPFDDIRDKISEYKNDI